MISQKINQNHSYKWIDVSEPSPEDFDLLHRDYALPYLLVQDCLSPEHLPKYEETDEGHFVILRSFDKNSSNEDTSVQELTRKIAFFITKQSIVTIHRSELAFLEAVSEKLRKTDSPKSMAILIHQMILASIRTYEEPLVRLQDLYDQFEQEIVAENVEQLSTKRIYKFRRQIFIIKRILKQTNDVLLKFRDFFEETPSMLQDLRENIDQLYFQLDEISDNFEHLFQLHISINDQRANEVMKLLTVFSTMLLPLNFIASFYGMNFEYIPGLRSLEALNGVVILMIAISIGTVWFFNRKGWFKMRGE